MPKGKWLLTVRLDFSASHQIRHYQGKCEALHGHNFGVEVVVSGDRTNDKTGMLVDFKDMKRETRKVLETLDHKHLNDIEPFLELSPSSEHIARYVYQSLKPEVVKLGANLEHVTVSEKAAQSATYFEEDE